MTNIVNIARAIAAQQQHSPVQATGHDEPRTMSDAESQLQTHIEGGVEVCFANPGRSQMQFVSALDRAAGMRAMPRLFECARTGTADGYARMADKPAATLLHPGPGLGNGLANLHKACTAQVPASNVIGDREPHRQRFDAMERRPGDQPHVLVVDDREEICKVVVEMLDEAGYRASCVHGAAEARAFLERQQPGVILLDVRLPGESGFSLARHATALGIPVLMMSGHPDSLAALEEGHLAFIAKPFSIAELVAAIQAVQQRRTAARRRCNMALTSISAPRFLQAGAGLVFWIGATIAAPASANARELSPLVPDVTALGDLSVMTYYTVEQDGFQVVATLQMEGPTGIAPLRIKSTLMPGQKAVISVPRAVGLKSLALEIARDGDRLTVTPAGESADVSVQMR